MTLRKWTMRQSNAQHIVPITIAGSGDQSIVGHGHPSLRTKKEQRESKKKADPIMHLFTGQSWQPYFVRGSLFFRSKIARPVSHDLDAAWPSRIKRSRVRLHRQLLRSREIVTLADGFKTYDPVAASPYI